jgi:uncharacterized protein (TIGR02145 family)
MARRHLRSLAFACALLFGCGGGAGSSTSYVDQRDGHTYSRVQVGSDTWMGENLAWEAPAGSFCYQDSAANCASGGRLYTFAAATSACPTGWHLSTDDEWKRLEAALGMETTALDLDYYSAPRGTDEGTKLKTGGTSGLDFPLPGYAEVGTDGAVTRWDGLGGSGNGTTYIWTPASSDPSSVLRRRLTETSPAVFRFSNPSEGYAVTVRCVANAPK